MVILTPLWLVANSVGAEGAVALAGSFKNNMKLRKLDLSRAFITSPATFASGCV